MTDVKYNYDWVLDAKEQRDAAPIDTSSKGIAAKPAEEAEAKEQDFLERMYDRFVSGFADEEEAIDAMSSKKPSREAVQSSVLDEMEELARQSAEEAALYRMEQDFLEHLNGEINEKAPTVPAPADTDSDELEILPASKDVQESAPLTAEPGLMSKPSKAKVPTTAEAKEIVAEEIGLSPELWDAYREEIAAIESGAEKDPYAAKGGANEHYDGMYQLGKVAKQDAAQLLGITLEHDKAAREMYRSDPALQEKAFAAYTAKNHDYLMKKSDKYRDLPLKEKLAVLGYAHNQGWGGANEWLRTGKVGEDAFGTKGTKYYDALTERLNR